MPFLKMPKSVHLPWMGTDVDERFWLDYTRQPGNEGTLHVRVVGPGTVDEATQLTIDKAEQDILSVRDKGPIRLRPYQHEAIESVQKSWNRGRKAPLVVLPTGAGKTVVAAQLMKLFREDRGYRCIFLAHRKELLAQTRDKIRVAGGGMRTGIVQGSKNEIGSHIDVTIASIQTLGGQSGKRLDEVLGTGRFDLVILDEAHHAVSAQWIRVIEAIRQRNPQVRMMGMTATPGRSDGLALDTVFDEVCFERNAFDLIRDGFLVPPKGFRVNLDLDLDKVKTENGDYASKQLSKLMNQPRVHEAIVRAWMEFGHNRKTIVFAVDVQHATDLAENFRDAGYTTDVVSGKTKPKDRDAIYERFSSGETKLLVNCLDSETEVLTKRGWVDMNSILPMDVTATASGTWESITHIISRPRAAGERMVCISNQTLSARVTEGHRMLVKSAGAHCWKVVTADHLVSRQGAYQLPLAAKLHHPGVPLSLDECMFIGLWMADGNADVTGSRGIEISQSDRYPAANKEVQRILTACGFDWRHHKFRTSKSEHEQNRYGIPKGTIGGALARRGYYHLLPWLNKSVSDDMFDMTREQFLAFLRGLWLGDGIKYEQRKLRNGVRRSWPICNTDVRMMTRVQALAVTRGFAANLSKPKSNGPLSTKPIYTLVVRDRDRVLTNNHTIATSGGNPARFEDEWREETVWCVSNADGTIITRRNGKVMVMGQCEVLTEGFDDPSIECVLFARPTQSQALYVQMMGRGLRPWPGKTECLIVDCVGNSAKHRPVQLASLVGFDPNLAVSNGQKRGKGSGEEVDEEEQPQVKEARIHGEEFDLGSRPQKAKYKWRETDFGWVLQIPRIGYYLCAWSDKCKAKCTIQFFDQRPKRRHMPPREVVHDPVAFDLAYGMVEGEMDRFFNARRQRDLFGWGDRDGGEFQNEDEDASSMELMSFMDVTDGLEDNIEVEESYMIEPSAWKSRPMSSKQRDLLLALGAKSTSLPETMREASDMILILQVARDRKNRVPASQKQMAFLRARRIDHKNDLTKGEAARLIIAYRKQFG